MSIVVLDPTQEPAGSATQHAMAPRLSTLTGKTLGLWSNQKLNATKLLDMISAELQTQFSFKVVRGIYDPCMIMPADGWGEVDTCDAVILANGDCGSCSTSGIANAIELEKRGIPSLLVSTPPFLEAAKTIAELRGMPQIQWAIVDHPIGSLKEDALGQHAKTAARQFLDLILQPAVKNAAE